MVIENYISNFENKKENKNGNLKTIEKKYKRLKIASICLLIAYAITVIFRF